MEKTRRAAAYSAEETELLETRYSANPTSETVNELAAELNKTRKSIIGKLSRMGIYRREAYRAKTGERPITKVEMRELIEDASGLSLEGLEKSPKAILRTFCEFFEIELE